MGFLHEAILFLAAAVLFVPIFSRLGLGSVLGYLAAGLVIGPYGFGLVAEVERLLSIAELGVVLLLFVIGLELEPSRLWQMRRTVFGVGGAQVVGTTVLLAIAGVALGGLSVPAALVVGAGLSLSSTAFALQLLAEKSQLTQPYGQASFGILLFQDLAVIPLLALLPVLGEGSGTDSGPIWLSLLRVTGALVAVFAAGRFLLRPLFRFLASIHSQEVMTAAALLVAGGTAYGVQQVGLSMSLGAFLAGVLLAESEYRHELEADIQPFKGLLLGLFFMAVGMSVDLRLVVAQPLAVFGLALALVTAKMLVLYGIGRRVLCGRDAALSLAVVISQGGEFAFVLFGEAMRAHIMDGSLHDLLIAVVTVSMVTTPFLYGAFERWVRPRLNRSNQPAPTFDVLPILDNPVVIAGFGRVGQMVARILRAKRIGFTALDSNPEHIEFVRKFGNRVFFGDASRIDLLRSAGLERARVFVLAIDSFEPSVRIAELLQQNFPHLIVYARARNRPHAYRLYDLGVDPSRVIRDTFPASLEMTEAILLELGLPYSEGHQAVTRFREHDERLLLEGHAHRGDPTKLTELALRGRAELETLFSEDERQQGTSAPTLWTG